MSGRKPKSKDYDIRAAVVAALLERGVPREAIRHENTLDTSSSGGRADVVVLHAQRLVTIEIKSASDKLDRLRDQIARYERSFDHVHVVCDVAHRDTSGVQRGEFYWCPEANGFMRFFGKAALPEPPEFINPRWGGSASTNVVNVARLLWRDEAVRVASALGAATNPRGTRVGAFAWMRENTRLADLRPLVIAELTARVPNRWEAAFWQRFDAGIEAAA